MKRLEKISNVADIVAIIAIIIAGCTNNNVVYNAMLVVVAIAIVIGVITYQYVSNNK